MPSTSKVTPAPSVSYAASSLPEGAFFAVRTVGDAIPYIPGVAFDWLAGYDCELK